MDALSEALRAVQCRAPCFSGGFSGADDGGLVTHLRNNTFGLIFAAGLTACSTGPQVPANGTMFGQVVATTVDSEVARYHLEDYLRGRTSDPALTARIDAVYRRYEGSVPSRDDLKAISTELSVDFASLFLVDRLLSSGCNRQLNETFARYVDGTIAAVPDPSAYRVLFVPGWDYVENGHVTGADFAQPRKLATGFGLDNVLVELPPTGSVEENARVLAASIAKHAATGKRLLLAGASSAGPAIHLALGEGLGRDESAAVKAWLNLGGILQGSPLVDYLQRWPQRWLFNVVAWFKDWDRSAILSMGTAPSRERFQRLNPDPRILVVNYLGVPLSGQVGRFSRDKYPLLRAEGPNDGLTLAADVIAPDSLTIVALGRDHFFAEDPQIDVKTLALMKLMLQLVEQGTGSVCAAD